VTDADDVYRNGHIDVLIGDSFAIAGQLCHAATHILMPLRNRRRSRIGSWRLSRIRALTIHTVT
jgi:hypothetical protein